jgi:hypothetical protein
LEISKKGTVPEFCRRRRNLSYAETENDHSVTNSLKVYSIPYVSSSLLLNIGALFRSGELKICRYNIILFNLYRTSSFSSSCPNPTSSRICAILPCLTLVFYSYSQILLELSKAWNRLLVHFRVVATALVILLYMLNEYIFTYV